MISYNKYVRAKSLEEAYQLSQKKGNIVIGGMIWLNLAKKRYQTVIDLCDLDLNKISESSDEFKIGAYVSLHTLEEDKTLNKYFNNVFHDAFCDIEGIQLRNMATIGGSVVLRSGFSDICTLLLAMNAKVELYKGGIISVEDYFKNDRTEKDILVSVIIPKKSSNSAYLAIRNTKTDLPVLNCVITKSDAIRVAIGSRPGIATLYVSDDINKVKNDAAISFSFDSNLRASAEYRKMIANVLVSRTLDKLKKEN